MNILLSFFLLTQAPAIVDLVPPSLTEVTLTPLISSQASTMHHERYLLAKKRLCAKFPHLEREFFVIDRLDLGRRGLSDEGKECFQQTIDILNELTSGSYDDQSQALYLRWLFSLFANHIEGGAVAAKKELDLFLASLAPLSSSTFQERDEKERGHSTSWTILVKNQPAAILKESAVVALPEEVSAKRSDPLCFSSFLRHLPDMPLKTKVADFEIIGFELDRLLGFNLVPPTVKAHFTHDDMTVEGSLQLYVKDGKPAGSSYIYSASSAQALLSIPAATVHQAAISGIFKGLMAHHMDNYLFIEQNGKIAAIQEIDLEEIMPPFNRVPLKAGAAKSLVLCRMWLMGLPQTKQPLDRALLMILTHGSAQRLLEGYLVKLAEKELVEPCVIEACAARYVQLQTFARQALHAPKSSLTARDLYFTIFGGRELYTLAKSHGYPDLVIFNNVVSDPYNHVIKDFSRPEDMASSDLLKPVTAQDSPERKRLKELFRALEGIT